jgi:hypothetical protein
MMQGSTTDDIIGAALLFLSIRDVNECHRRSIRNPMFRFELAAIYELGDEVSEWDWETIYGE